MEVTKKAIGIFKQPVQMEVKGIRATRNDRGVWTLVTNSYNGSHKSLDLLIKDSKIAVQEIVIN